MPIQGFDIASLRDFKPPKYFCPQCYALFSDLEAFEISRNENELVVLSCPTCKTQFISKQSRQAGHAIHVFKTELAASGYEIDTAHCLEHGQKLAKTALLLGQQSYTTVGKEITYTPQMVLLKALSQAEHFVHFTSYGISEFYVGVFKLLAQRVHVRGVVSNLDPERNQWDRLKVEELTNNEETIENIGANLAVKVFGSNYDAPHSKLVVIDGLLAFTGSANLTNSGLKKAAAGRDSLEVVTNINRIIQLNNKYFSSVWRTWENEQELFFGGDMGINPWEW